jgi:hypothetical protein
MKELGSKKREKDIRIPRSTFAPEFEAPLVIQSAEPGEGKTAQGGKILSRMSEA